MQRARLLAVGVVIAITCGARAAAATGGNLVQNGSFNVSLRHWHGNFPGWLWSADDADQAPDSGSAALVSSYPASLDPYSLRTRCFPVEGGASYRFSATTKLTYDPGVLTTGGVGVSWCRGALCGRCISRSELAISHGDWRTRSLDVTAPVDASSAVVSIYLLKTGGGAGLTLTANFDNIDLTPLDATSTTTTTLACGGICGDPVAELAKVDEGGSMSRDISASDALYILRVALGEQSCPLCVCDVDGSGDVTATDGLLTLAAVTGQPVTFSCPSGP